MKSDRRKPTSSILSFFFFLFSFFLRAILHSPWMQGQCRWDLCCMKSAPLNQPFVFYSARFPDVGAVPRVCGVICTLPALR